MSLAVELTIIIVNWNGGDLLRRAVESIIASPPSLAYEILIIDNASSDQSLATLRASASIAPLLQEQRLRIIENSENSGFGKANNQAFAIAHGSLFFLLNPDTEVTQGSLDVLIETIRANKQIGGVGPKLVNTDGSLQVSVWRNPPAAWEILLSQLKLYLLLPRRVRGTLLLGGHWDHDRIRDVPMLSGAAMLVRREMIDDVGGFDERFHMYGEDNEWCYRITQRGWHLMFQPAAVILHHGAKSALQRWKTPEKLRVQLAANYFFQQHSLPQRRVIANQLASYVTAWGQDWARRVRGIKAPEITLAKQIHWQNFKRSLRSSPDSQ